MDYRRQTDLFDPDLFENTWVTIVGMGNIGSHAALALTRMGIQHFSLYDFDTVEEHNLSSQSYGHEDIGLPKVMAVTKQMRAINPDLEVVMNEKAFDGNELLTGVLVIGVDTMDARKSICQLMREYDNVPDMIIDGRIGGNQLELYIPESLEAWEKTFSDNPSEDPCGGRYIAYVSTIIGGLIAKQVQKHLTGSETDKSIMMDINSLQVVKNFEW